MAKQKGRPGQAGRAKAVKRRVHTSLAVKLLILALLAAAACRLYALQGEVAAAQAERDSVAAQVEIQRQKNDALSADIAEGATPEKMQEIARRELGWVLPGEYIFSISN